jgi:lysophospholipase L1-like esterase
VAGITLLMLVGLEAIARGVYWAATPRAALGDIRATADGYAGVDWVEGYFREFRDSEYSTWTPYLYWRRRPFGGTFINVDERGIRKTWNPPADPGQPARVRVFMFGGSALWGTGARDEHTIASLVSRRLDAEFRLPALVTNFGESGYVSTQEVILLMLELRRGHRPDVVVFYDGYNDVFAAYQSGTAGLPSNEVNRRREFNLLNPRDEGWGRRLLREAAALAVEESRTLRLLNTLLDRARGRRGRPEPTGPEVDLDRLADETVAVYEGNMALVTRLGRSYGFTARFFWQPFIFDKRQATPYEAAWREELRYLEPFYRRVAERIAARLGRGDGFVDLSRLFADDRRPYFIDAAHLTEPGNDRVAERLAAPVAEAVRAVRERRRAGTGGQSPARSP